MRPQGGAGDYTGLQLSHKTKEKENNLSPSRLPPLLFQQSLPSYHLGKQRKTPPNSPLLSDQEEPLTLALFTKQNTLTYLFFPHFFLLALQPFYMLSSCPFIG